MVTDGHPIADISAEVASCRLCPRLVRWREQVAATKRSAFRDEDYWGRPVPGFGDPDPRLLIVGLAPAAHGANRTGRMFTGDRSGEWLYGSLHRCGYASQPDAHHLGDGLALEGAFITASVRCAPPANKPTAQELATCSRYLERELDAFAALKVVVALGGIAWNSFARVASSIGWEVPRPRPRFGHGAEYVLGSVTVIGSYHPSQQNTFTGRLTRDMLDSVFLRARELTG